MDSERINQQACTVILPAARFLHFYLLTEVLNWFKFDI